MGLCYFIKYNIGNVGCLSVKFQSGEQSHCEFWNEEFIMGLLSTEVQDLGKERSRGELEVQERSH